VTVGAAGAAKAFTVRAIEATRLVVAFRSLFMDLATAILANCCALRLMIILLDAVHLTNYCILLFLNSIEIGISTALSV
jgi:hypothetical protein